MKNVIYMSEMRPNVARKLRENPFYIPLLIVYADGSKRYAMATEADMRPLVERAERNKEDIAAWEKEQRAQDRRVVATVVTVAALFSATVGLVVAKLWSLW